MSSKGADVLDETLGRLSKKPGVKATLVLDRESGAILKTSGQISSLRVPKPAESSSSPTPAGTASFGNNSNDEANGDEPSSHEQGIEEIAAMMWNFVSTADSLTQELDAEVSSIFPDVANCQPASGRGFNQHGHCRMR
jgi:dynein light chain roadblock-type